MRNRTTGGWNGWIHIVCAAAMLAATCAGAQIDRRDPVHNEAVALPSPVHFSHTDHFAREIYYFGEGVFHTTFKNTTGRSDTFRMSIESVIPEGLGSFDWLGFYCDTGGACHFGPWDYVLDAGESETFDVHLTDNVGSTEGMALTTLTATWGRGRTSITLATFVERPSILLVDDDDGASYETLLEEAVDDAGYEARSWGVDVLGRPGLDVLSSHRAVLWTTADGSATYIDSADEQNMMDYLDGGGRLMLASMEYLSSRMSANSFMSDYLHLLDWSSDVGVSPVAGVASDPISDGMSLSLTGGPFPPDNGDAVFVDSPAEPIFSNAAGPMGLRVEEAGHKLVFLGFAIENVGDTAPDPDNRATLVERIIDWLVETVPTRGGELRGLALEQNAPNPFNPHTEIAFTVPENAGLVTLTVHNVGGQVVRTLVSDALPPGPAVAAWDGRDEGGGRAATGVYFARLSAGSQSVFRKMMLLK